MAEPFLVLHPRAAPAGTIQIWLGAFHYTDPPDLTWFLGEAEQAPHVVRPLNSARPPEWLQGSPARAFTGLFEFSVPTVQNRRISPLRVVPSGGRGDSLDIVRGLPAAIPEGPDHWFNILLASCFHWSQDKAGSTGGIIRRLPASFRPDLTLLLGDQVYLDLPAFYPFRSDTAWLAERFEEDYARNWTQESTYRSVLRAAPSVSTPDDHEYWNNFPHSATIIRNTWTKTGRERWKAAASRLYEAFQLPVIPLPGALSTSTITGTELGDPVVLTIPPLSFFILDSRSSRAENRSRSIKAGAINVLKEWASAVKENEHFGVVVTGQSFVEEGAGFWGRFTDYKLKDYEDLDDQLLEIVHLARDGGRPVVLITGDVHWGRVANVKEKGHGAMLHEVISSPTALVEDPRQKVGRAWKAVRGLFSGAVELWPEHHDPPMERTEIGFQKEPGTRLECTPVHPQKGNHVAVLSFQRRGLGLRMRVLYWSIHEKLRSTVPIRLPDVDLKPRP